MTQVHRLGLFRHDATSRSRPKLRPPSAFRTLVRMLADNWTVGSLTISAPGEEDIRVMGREDGPNAIWRIKDFRFVGRVLKSGLIGFAEGYIEGEWDTPDLAVLLVTFSRNLDKISKLLEGNAFTRTVLSVFHAFNRNSRQQAKKNIAAHYDLGNDFYSLWLDPSMTYSSALYATPKTDLAGAQHEKYAALARAMDLRRDETVLEIGCGWGGFAEFAAKEVGAKVTGITISRAQHDFARERLFKAGLAERAEIRLIDYRDVTGAFDRIASIEMFEAVGEEYWPTYFNKVHDLLAPDGKAGLQIITIREDLFEAYRARPDFIQTYIFPGGMLPTPERLDREFASAGLAKTGVKMFGLDYARTLADWTHRFDGVLDKVSALGFDERFQRLWRFYLGYCGAGFSTGRIDVGQWVLARA